MPSVSIKSFNTGVVTPKIDARDDLEKFDSACRYLNNMLPLEYGCAEERPGTEFIYEAKHSPQGCRLIPFIYSAEIAYMCEFGDLYSRFYYNGAILLDGETPSVPVEITTTYLVADLPQLQYHQIADTMWLVHQDYKQRKLTRTSVTAFAINDITFKTGPFRTRNDLIDPTDLSTITMTPSNDLAVGDTGTLTASSGYWVANHIGQLYEITQPRVAVDVEQSGAGSSSWINVKGTFSFNTHGTWTGTVKLERRVGSDQSAAIETYRTYIGKDDRNVQLSATETEVNVEYRITAEAGMSAAFGADITVHNSTQKGVVRITGITNTTLAATEVVVALASTNTTRRWAEGSWSISNGYPAAICFYGNRCVYAGSTTDTTSLWLSAVGDYENFDVGQNDADSFEVQLTTQDEIRWIQEFKNGIVIGTSGGNWSVTSNEINTPLTPTNYLVKQQKGFGSKEIQAVTVGDSTLFTDFTGRKILEYAFSPNIDVYSQSDMTLLAENITVSSINAVALQSNPDTILWSMLDNGKLLSMTFNREQKVVAWAEHYLNLSALDSSGTDWQISAAASYKLTYIDSPGAIWGVPINYWNRTTLTLDAGQPAIDKGGGKVGLPCTGHPFSSGQTVVIQGTTNYDSASITLETGTTAKELVITDTYVEETFDGTETVVSKITIATGKGRMVQDSTGILYYGTNAPKIGKIAADGTHDNDLLTPDGGWPAVSDVIGIALTSDDAFLYVAINVDAATDYCYLYKFDLSDGSEVWALDDSGDDNAAGAFPGFDMTIDSSENVYILATAGAGSGNNNAVKYTTADGTKTEMTLTGTPGVNPAQITAGGQYAIWVDNDISYSNNTGVLLTGGYMFSGIGFNNEENLYNLAIRDLDNTDGAQIALGGTYESSGVDKTYLIGSKCIVTLGGYIYVLGWKEDDTEPTLWKLDSNLDIVAGPVTAESGQAPIGLFISLNGEIVVVSQSVGSPKSDIFWFYDTDLNYLDTKIDGFLNTMLSGWVAGSGALVQGTPAFYPGISYPGSTTAFRQDAVGTVQSIAVLPNTSEDEIWAAVLLSVDGTPRRYITRMKPRLLTTLNACFFVDCGTTITNSPASSTLAGLDHLEGLTVTGLIDGVVMDDAVVSSGQVTAYVDEVETTVSTGHVGLPFTYKLQPMRPTLSGPGGTTHGSKLHVPEMGISFLNTLGAKYGVSDDALEVIDFDYADWVNHTEISGLFTGDVIESVDGGFSLDAPLIISSSAPLPCTVRALIPKLDVTSR